MARTAKAQIIKAKKATRKKRSSPRPKVSAARAAPEQPIPTPDLGALNEALDLPGVRGNANTIIYIHGIGAKPKPSTLQCQWDTALFGRELGDRSRMAYWVNKEYYPDYAEGTCSSGDRISLDDSLPARTRAFAVGDADRALEHEIAELTDDPARRQFLKRIADRMVIGGDAAAKQGRARGVGARILPVEPWRRWLTRGLTQLFLRDVYDFFYEPERRRAMEKALLDRLAPGGGPFIVIGHSQGSMIAYNVLRRLDPQRFPVSLFITIGSPLGMDEVQDVFRDWTGARGALPFPACVKSWSNFADRFDPVALDQDLNGEFDKKIDDVQVENTEGALDAHSATGYLSASEVRNAVREVAGTAFGQIIGPFAISKDLSRRLEDEGSATRHEVLIQLAKEGVEKPGQTKALDETARRVTQRIERMVREGDSSAGAAKVERLRHFLAANLTRIEVETLRSLVPEFNIQGIWRNAAKKALIAESTHTVQARPANLGYGADGNNICWGVLDTGISADHPHFRTYSSVHEQWDCTKPDGVEPVTTKSRKFGHLDDNGHGTHVAGIIAGWSEAKNEEGEDLKLSGMAPRCKLYGFKVLDRNGDGKDSWIIRGLDLVAKTNEDAGKLVIHGINLSLGGNFDPSAFGCGHTPLCQELRRLWRQGVLVCLAAGNEGYAVLSSAEGEIPTNLDLSIGDPANLEEAIAVGSVHKTNPLTYGISYFSSRGPTADGRRKPDLVAPGEKILSASHIWKTPAQGETAKVDDNYVAMSGTSMAAPHVSGILAAFLSLRREFIGYPDRVKGILLESCSDLRRDPYMQGAGLPNLIKMLAFN